MFYFILLTILINIDHSYAQQKSIANIVMTRGRDIYVYTAGKKTTVSGTSMPLTLYAGDEVQVGMDSDCELVFANNDTMYAGSESLFSVDSYKNDMNYVWIKYGSLLYRGIKPAAIKASDLFATTKGGDFLITYRTNSSESTILNFGKELEIKQGDEEIPYILSNNRFVKIVSFSFQKKMGGSINPDKVPFIYETFRIAFSPSEKVIDLGSFNTSERDKAMDYNKKANLDFVKRTIGL